MKTLLIMRHAKSSWNDATLADHDRPLNKRGKRDAPRMGELLREKELVPDLIISSTAKRARVTASKVAGACGYRKEVKKEEALYHGDPTSWIDILRGVSGDFDKVMIVGHNPGLEAFLSLLTGRGELMPTATIAQVQLPIDDWRNMEEAPSGTLVNLWRPKEL